MSGKIRKGWRKLRVIVEVPVCGDYSTRDLVWDIDRLVSGSQLNEKQKITGRKIQFGKVSVKEAERMIKVLQEERMKKIHEQMDKEQARLTKALEEIEEME